MQNDWLLKELARFSRPLFEFSSSSAAVENYFQQFGFKMNPAHANGLFESFLSLKNAISSALYALQAAANDTRADPLIVPKLVGFIKLVGSDTTIRSYFGGEFLAETFDYLMYRHLSENRRSIFALLNVLGVIKLKKIDPSVRGLPFTRVDFEWVRLVHFISKNKKWSKEVYGWAGNPGAGDDKKLDYEKLFTSLALLIDTPGFSFATIKTMTATDIASFLKNNVSGTNFYTLSLPFLQDDFDDVTPEGEPVFSKEAGVKLLPYGDLSRPEELGFAISPFVKGAVGGVQPLSKNIDLKFSISTGAVGGQYVAVTPIGLKSSSGGSVSAKFESEIVYSEADPPKPVALISFSEKSKLQSDAVSLAFGGDINGDVYLRGGFKNLNATFDFGGDGFLKNFLNDPIKITAGDLFAKWQFNKGVSFEGGNNLEIVVPVHLAFGPIKIRSFGVQIQLADETGIVFNTSGDLAFGPLVATFESIGFKARISPKPPKGIGLSIDTGVLRGGGFLYIDADRGEYAGAIELTFAEFLSLKAVGIITTKMPDGSDGFSLLVIITAEFGGGGLQLGFGFTLLGVGGLVGLNRTVRLDSLISGVRNGSINNIMFPRNVIANAPRIISDLRSIFPPRNGTFLIGPMAKLGWGTPTLVSISLGVIIEIPGNIGILGVLRVSLPAEESPVVLLQVSFAGAIEFDKKRLYFFASLFDSRVLFITLDGDMGLLAAFGDDANFVLSIGGFHPRFTPPPLPFPIPTRISVSILNESWGRIRADGYFAVTSNTAQFGSRTEIYFGFSALSVESTTSFDALLQFSPFSFIVEVGSNFSVKVFGLGVWGLSIQLMLAGPAPWHAKGRASISLLFFDIDVDFDETWGERRGETLPVVEILPLLTAEFGKKENWRAFLPEGKTDLVTLRKFEAAEDTLVLHPAGSLRVLQKLVPLGITISKLGNRKTADCKKFSLTVVPGVVERKNSVKEHFAAAQFNDLNDNDRLSAAAFHDEDGGIDLNPKGVGSFSATAVRRVNRYELVTIDTAEEPKRKKYYYLSPLLSSRLLKGSAAALSPLSVQTKLQKNQFADKVVTKTEGFAIAMSETNTNLKKELLFSSEASAREFMNGYLQDAPAMAGKIHVVPTFELAA
jgi:hypothetical protein